MAQKSIGLVAAAAIAGLVIGSGATYLATSGTSILTSTGDRPPATGADAGEPAADDVVVARVNGEPIYRSELMETYSQLPPQAQQMGIDALYPMLLERVIDTELLKIEAGRKLLSDDPEVARKMAQLREQVEVQVYFEGQIDEKLTEEKMQSHYQQYLQKNPAMEEVRARHILVETEEQANDIVGEIKGGADFAELAKEHSTGPSGPSGGDLGYFTRDQMVQPFSEAAFALQPGEVTTEPVKTQFGWHVIKVEDRRTKEQPTLEDMRDQFEDELTREIVNEMIAALREQAEIETFDIEGNPTAGEGEAALEESGSGQQQ